MTLRIRFLREPADGEVRIMISLPRGSRLRDLRPVIIRDGAPSGFSFLTLNGKYLTMAGKRLMLRTS